MSGPVLTGLDPRTLTAAVRWVARALPARSGLVLDDPCLDGRGQRWKLVGCDRFRVHEHVLDAPEPTDEGTYGLDVRALRSAVAGLRVAAGPVTLDLGRDDGWALVQPARGESPLLDFGASYYPRTESLWPAVNAPARVETTAGVWRELVERAVSPEHGGEVGMLAACRTAGQELDPLPAIVQVCAGDDGALVAAVRRAEPITGLPGAHGEPPQPLGQWPGAVARRWDAPVGFNPAYLADALHGLPSTAAVVARTDSVRGGGASGREAGRGVAFAVEGVPGRRALVMPVRLPDAA